MDPLAFLAEHSTAAWSAVSGVASGAGALFLSFRTLNLSRERVQMKMSLEASASETAERAAFRSTLIAELSRLRAMIKECEADKELLRERLNTAEAQILVLKASNEIMEKWVAFFRDGISPQPSSLMLATRHDDTP